MLGLIKPSRLIQSNGNEQRRLEPNKQRRKENDALSAPVVLEPVKRDGRCHKIDPPSHRRAGRVVRIAVAGPGGFERVVRIMLMFRTGRSDLGCGCPKVRTGRSNPGWGIVCLIPSTGAHTPSRPPAPATETPKRNQANRICFRSMVGWPTASPSPPPQSQDGAGSKCEVEM